MKKKFVLDYFLFEWDIPLLESNMNADKFYETFLEKLYSTKISKFEIYFKDKPLITSGIEKSISIKNQFLSKFARLKDTNKKEALIRYKENRNLLSILLKK